MKVLFDLDPHDPDDMRFLQVVSNHNNISLFHDSLIALFRKHGSLRNNSSCDEDTLNTVQECIVGVFEEYNIPFE